jgi:hypothetical protein
MALTEYSLQGQLSYAPQVTLPNWRYSGAIRVSQELTDIFYVPLSRENHFTID